MVAKTPFSKINPGVICKPRAPLTHKNQQVIIYLRFGSLNNFSKLRMSVAQIAKSIKRPWTTVYAVIKRFVENNYQIINRRN